MTMATQIGEPGLSRSWAIKGTLFVILLFLLIVLPPSFTTNQQNSTNNQQLTGEEAGEPVNCNEVRKQEKTPAEQ